jgi:hypothetical protein
MALGWHQRKSGNGVMAKWQSNNGEIIMAKESENDNNQ